MRIFQIALPGILGLGVRSVRKDGVEVVTQEVAEGLVAVEKKRSQEGQKKRAGPLTADYDDRGLDRWGEKLRRWRGRHEGE